MKVPVRLRWTEFLIAVLGVAVVVVFTERSAWRQISRLRQELRPERIDQFRTADVLRASVLEVHEAWHRVEDDGGATNQALLEFTSQNLEKLINARLSHADSVDENQVLTGLARECREYLAAVMISQKPSRVTNEKPEDHRREQAVEAGLGRCLKLCEQLTEANKVAAQGFLVDVGGALTRLQRFLFVSLLGLLGSAVLIVILAYRRLLAPLRTSLAETKTLMERQEKLASLGVFAAGIAHEIRNPLTAIKVRLFTLKDGHPPGSSDHEDLEVIASEINRLERIVQDFLRFARPAEPDLLNVPIGDFLREVYTLMQPELKKKRILFKLEVSVNEVVQLDPEKMKQVLINLVHNAAESIDGEGTVTLRSRTDRRIVDGHLLPAVVIEVSDTGKGIPPEVQKRLFDPFFTTKERGTGLGLPIAARIVEKHGGIMQYDTQLNQGTTFSILLPKASL